MAKTVLFVLTSHNQKGNTGQTTGFYLPEAAHPWAQVIDAGFNVAFTSPQGGKPPVDGLESAAQDRVCQRFLADPQVQTQLTHTPTPETLNAADYAGIFYVGGHGSIRCWQGNSGGIAGNGIERDTIQTVSESLTKY